MHSANQHCGHNCTCYSDKFNCCGNTSYYVAIEIAQLKQNPRSGDGYTIFGYETKTGVVRISVSFQHRPVQPYRWKALAETFLMIWLNIGLSWKITTVRSTPTLVRHPKQV